jgi:hypothetical protein
MTRAARALNVVDDICATTATCHGLAFLEKMPPRKSEMP